MELTRKELAEGIALLVQSINNVGDLHIMRNFDESLDRQDELADYLVHNVDKIIAFLKEVQH